MKSLKKVYLAAKFSRREELEKLVPFFKECGYECVARWVFGGEDGLSREDIALLDLEDIDKADTIVLFTHPRGEPQPGGGRFVEFGYALANNKECIVIGPAENVFISHPKVIRFDNLEAFAVHKQANHFQLAIDQAA